MAWLLMVTKVEEEMWENEGMRILNMCHFTFLQFDTNPYFSHCVNFAIFLYVC